jgi:regulator of sigma E protease
VDYIGKIVTGRASGDKIAGPLGILSASGHIATASLAAPADTPGGPIGTLAINLFKLCAILSVAVGFVNILPIPVLDGGHLVFYGIEAARGGRPLPLRAQEWAFWTGVSVLLSLFLFATWNDITHHLSGLQ